MKHSYDVLFDWKGDSLFKKKHYRLKGSGAVGFAGLISLDMLTSHRFEPNELIAPTIDSSAINVEPQLERVTITVSIAK